MTGDQKKTAQPRRRFNFVVDIDGVGTKLHFQEVSGHGSESRPVDHRAGRGKRPASKKMPVTAKPGSVTLKRGMIAKHDSFAEWYTQIQKGTVQRATVRIRLLDENGSPVMAWTLVNAFPKKISGPALNAQANEVAIEELEIEHEGLKIADDEDDEDED
jgi:phage tail-like protein